VFRIDKKDMMCAFSKVFTRLLESADLLHDTKMGKNADTLQLAALLRDDGIDVRAYEHLRKAHGHKRVDD
jgi:hypothetical protein